MSEKPVQRFELEVETGIEPVTGRLRVPEGPELHFVGVLELIASVDQARGVAEAIAYDEEAFPTQQ